jgi:Adenylate and Guanylate cyclase catalytic domain
VRICASCGRSNPLDAGFCNGYGAALAPAATPREIRKTVTLLFCDVTGSTTLGESMDPEALRALLARFFERMKAIVESHGGTVEKFIGDAVMTVFGVPSAFHWTGEVLTMPTFLAAPHVRHAAGRLRALRANSNVAVTIDTETFPPQVLTPRGDCQPIASGWRQGFRVRRVAGSEQGTVPGPARAHGSSVRRPL